jgi:hypothetical protein
MLEGALSDFVEDLMDPILLPEFRSGVSAYTDAQPKDATTVL